jgi:hypothetical protein
MRSLIVVTLVTVAAFATSASIIRNYGWEDGLHTIPGSYGNVVDPTNVTGPQSGSDGGAGGTYGPSGANSGERYLHVAEQPHSSTPQAFLAFVENLAAGDVVDASFFGYDETAGASPSLRIWGHYAFNGDIDSYDGSAGGNSDYTAGTGWDQVSHSWTVEAGKEALVIEARLYSTPATSEDRTDYWIDDLSVTAPDTATITIPEPGTMVLLGLGGLAALLRRRR